MAKWGSCDFSELKKFQQKINRLANSEIDKFIRDVAKELAARLLAKDIKRTPVGDYSREIKVVAKRDGKKYKKGETYIKRVNPGGKVGGTLRRGWTAKSHQEAEDETGKTVSAEKQKNWVNQLPIKKSGDIYKIDVINIVRYSSYVELGHRTRNHKGWVEGKFMMTISEKELEADLPGIIEKKLQVFLSEVF